MNGSALSENGWLWSNLAWRAHGIFVTDMTSISALSASKPIFLCVPSQKGFCPECPQRHRASLGRSSTLSSPFSRNLAPAGRSMANGPFSRRRIFMKLLLRVEVSLSSVKDDPPILATNPQFYPPRASHRAPCTQGAAKDERVITKSLTVSQIVGGRFTPRADWAVCPRPRGAQWSRADEPPSARAD